MDPQVIIDELVKRLHAVTLENVVLSSKLAMYEASATRPNIEDESFVRASDIQDAVS